GQVDFQLSLVGLAEVDLDLLAFSLIGLIENLRGRDVRGLGAHDLADRGGGGLAVGRPARRAGDAAAHAPLATVQLDPLLVSLGRGVAEDAVVFHVNRHGSLPLGNRWETKITWEQEFSSLTSSMGFLWPRINRRD